MADPEQLAWSIIETCDWWKAQARACHILAIDPELEEDDGITAALVAAAEGRPEQALRVALALTLGTDLVGVTVRETRLTRSVS